MLAQGIWGTDGLAGGVTNIGRDNGRQRDRTVGEVFRQTAELTNRQDTDRRWPSLWGF